MRHLTVVRADLVTGPTPREIASPEYHHVSVRFEHFLSPHLTKGGYIVTLGWNHASSLCLGPKFLLCSKKAFT